MFGGPHTHAHAAMWHFKMVRFIYCPGCVCVRSFPLIQKAYIKHIKTDLFSFLLYFFVFWFLSQIKNWFPNVYVLKTLVYPLFWINCSIIDLFLLNSCCYCCCFSFFQSMQMNDSLFPKKKQSFQTSNCGEEEIVFFI